MYVVSQIEFILIILEFVSRKCITYPNPSIEALTRYRFFSRRNYYFHHQRIFRSASTLHAIYRNYHIFGSGVPSIGVEMFYKCVIMNRTILNRYKVTIVFAKWCDAFIMVLMNFQLTIYIFKIMVKTHWTVSFVWGLIWSWNIHHQSFHEFLFIMLASTRKGRYRHRCKRTMELFCVENIFRIHTMNTVKKYRTQFTFHWNTKFVENWNETAHFQIRILTSIYSHLNHDKNFWLNIAHAVRRDSIGSRFGSWKQKNWRQRESKRQNLSTEK